jgi:hypothetical protein
VRERSNVRLRTNEYVSIEEALKCCVAGDTLMLDPGHHWEHTLAVNTHIRIVGDARDPSRVVRKLCCCWLHPNR